MGKMGKVVVIMKIIFNIGEDNEWEKLKKQLFVGKQRRNFVIRDT